MKSRMDKYYNDQETIVSRTAKNADLYQGNSQKEIEDFNVNSNVKVLGTNSNNIDLEKLKDILDKKYNNNNVPKRRSINIEEENNVDKPLVLEETREYDITTILERAKEEKEKTYEEERLKKVRDTQYDILKNLDLKKQEDEYIETNSTEDELLNLINTIAEREATKKIDPLDLFEDLKGTENTLVLEGIRETPQELSFMKTEPLIEVNPPEKEPVIVTVESKDNTKTKIDTSFYTNPMSFSQSDFDDFNDLKEELKSSKLLINLLIFFVIVAILVGIFLVFNNIFEWKVF